jgi:hypothetical protein
MPMRRNLLNLVLAAGVATLGAIAWFGQNKPEQKAMLTALTPAEVQKIAIEHAGEPTIQLERRGPTWHLVQPVDARADGYTADSIAALAATPVESTVESAAKRAELGLEPPAFWVTLNDERIGFGGEEPLRHQRYVLHGDAVALIEPPAGAALDDDWTDLVARELLPPGAPIRRIVLPELVAEKNAEGKWTAPGHDDIPPDRLQTLATAWKAARANWTSAADPGDADKPVARIELEQGPIVELHIVSQSPQLVLADTRLGVRYTLGGESARDLLNLPVPPASPASDAAAPPGGPPAPATPPASPKR